MTTVSKAINDNVTRKNVATWSTIIVERDWNFSLYLIMEELDYIMNNCQLMRNFNVNLWQTITRQRSMIDIRFHCVQIRFLWIFMIRNRWILFEIHFQNLEYCWFTSDWKTIPKSCQGALVKTLHLKLSWKWNLTEYERNWLG